MKANELNKAAEEYSGRFQDGKDKLYAFHGFRDGASWRDSQIQRLSNGIDGAAELSANDAMIKRQFPSVVYNTGLKCFDHSDLIKQFKAGAEWQRERMMENTVECDVYGHCSGWLTFGYVPECDFDFKPGDKVKLIIIKED